MQSDVPPTPARTALRRGAGHAFDRLRRQFSHALASPATTHAKLSAVSQKKIADTLAQYVGYLVAVEELPVTVACTVPTLADPLNVARFARPKLLGKQEGGKGFGRASARTLANHLYHILCVLNTLVARKQLGWQSNSAGMPDGLTVKQVAEWAKRALNSAAVWQPLGPRQAARPTIKQTSPADYADWQDAVLQAAENVDDLDCEQLRDLVICALLGGVAPPLRSGVLTTLSLPGHAGGCLVPGCTEPACCGNRLLEVAATQDKERHYAVSVGHAKNRQPGGPALTVPLPPGLTSALDRYLEIARTDGGPSLLTNGAGTPLTGPGQLSDALRCASRRFSPACSFTCADARFLFVRRAEAALRRGEETQAGADSLRDQLARCMVSSLDAWKRAYSRAAGDFAPCSPEAYRAAFGHVHSGAE